MRTGGSEGSIYGIGAGFPGVSTWGITTGPPEGTAYDVGVGVSESEEFVAEWTPLWDVETGLPEPPDADMGTGFPVPPTFDMDAGSPGVSAYGMGAGLKEPP